MGDALLKEIHKFAERAAEIWPEMVEAVPYLQELQSRHPTLDSDALSSELRWAFRTRDIYAADDPWNERDNRLTIDRPFPAAF